VHESDVWTEVTTLLIPGLNDSPDELGRMFDWYLRELGPEVPLHLTAFHPDYKLDDRPPTPPSTLRRARRQALVAGLRHVYTGNIVDVEGQATHCTACGTPVVERDGYRLLGWALTDDGACRACGHPLAGRFQGAPGRWGSRRMRVVP
jgi:pyruvate formate lyase activating enzyme